MTRKKLVSALAALGLVAGLMVFSSTSAGAAPAKPAVSQVKAKPDYTALPTCIHGLNVSVAAFQTGPSGTAHFGGSVDAAVIVPEHSVCDTTPTHPAANQQTISYVETRDNHGDYLLVGFYPDIAGVDSCGAGKESVLTDYNGTIRHNYGRCAVDGSRVELGIDWVSTASNCYMASITYPPTIPGVGSTPTDLACFGGPGNNAFTGFMDEGVAGQVGYGQDSDMYGDATNSGAGSGVETFTGILLDNTSHVGADACTANGSAPADAFNVQAVTGTFASRFEVSSGSCDTATTQTVASP